MSVSTIFIWFGILKLADRSPVAQLVADTLPWVEPGRLVPTLGAVEVLLGLALLTTWPHPLLVPATTIGHLTGTFLVLVTQPAKAFQEGNPLLLTTIGEFVMKNVVLIAALLVLASQPRNATAQASASHRE